ncbi:MAG: class I SAM-dependent methyltransferase [Pseudohongiellaceae bacterium]
MRYHLLPRRLTMVAMLVFLPFAVPGAAAQEYEHPGYEQDPSRSEGGIGKFYLGREISQVMGHQAAGWLERPQREQEELPDQVVANMELEPDDVVADIGAGTGYFSFRLAERVPEGRVLAVDIQQEMLDLIEQRAQEEDVDNVEPVLGRVDDPRLPENAVDAVLMVDAYHEFSHPWEMMNGIVQSLKPGGRVVLLEYREEDPRVPIRPLHKMSEEQVVREMLVFDLEWDATLDFLPWQHMMIFSKPE